MDPVVDAGQAQSLEQCKTMGTPNFSTDTSDEACHVQLDLIRRMTPVERFLKACAMSQRCRQMAMDAIRRHHPGICESELRLKFIELAYGRDLADQVRDWQRIQRS